MFDLFALVALAAGAVALLEFATTAWDQANRAATPWRQQRDSAVLVLAALAIVITALHDLTH